ncbi:MAG: ABC transporter ATP-binding protein [Actinomycetes bacterium]
MEKVAISASDLTKIYGEQTALSHGNFVVPEGSICGFVGPNGSGKTTTIRMLLGLIAPSGGTATVLGESISHPEKYLPRVGAMIEGPAFYPALSGRENLKVLAELGGFPLSRVDQLLEKVDLADRGGSKFKTYSLGMKQRLGIAAALLPNPELLILDEPTNGLDPSGIQEVRGIIRDLADSGTTIFVSSHILSELEMICEYLVMLREGKVIFSGRTQELLSGQKPMIIAKPEYDVDLTSLANKLSEFGFQISIVDGSLQIDAAKEASATINRMAFEAGITLASISVVLPTLEETFFEMTGDNK